MYSAGRENNQITVAQVSVNAFADFHGVVEIVYATVARRRSDWLANFVGKINSTSASIPKPRANPHDETLPEVYAKV